MFFRFFEVFDHKIFCSESNWTNLDIIRVLQILCFRNKTFSHSKHSEKCSVSARIRHKGRYKFGGNVVEALRINFPLPLNTFSLFLKTTWSKYLWCRSITGYSYRNRYRDHRFRIQDWHPFAPPFPFHPLSP